MLHKAQAMHCNHFRMLSFYSPFHFPLILWLNVSHVHDRILAEMVLISAKQMAILKVKDMKVHGHKLTVNPLAPLTRLVSMGNAKPS